MRVQFLGGKLIVVRKKPKPVVPVQLNPGEFGGWLGEQEVDLIWSNYDAEKGYYRPQAWMLRFPEYMGMHRFFLSLNAPWAMLVRSFQQKNEFLEGSLGQRHSDYLQAIARAISSFEAQRIEIRGIPKKKTKRGFKSSHIPEPKTVYQFFRAHLLLGIPRAISRLFFRKVPLSGTPRNTGQKMSEYLLARHRVPVESVNLMPNWDQAVAFSKIWLSKSDLANQPTEARQSIASKPKLNSLAEVLMGHALKKNKKESFKDLVVTFGVDLDPITADRETLLELFAYQSLAMTIKRVEDFSSLIAANQTLPEERRLSSREIWSKWSGICDKADGTMFKDIEKSVVSARAEA